MKKPIMVVILVAVLLMFTMGVAAASTSKTNDENQYHIWFLNTLAESKHSEQSSLSSNTYQFPESLQVIGEEAFEGTAVTKIYLPESLTTIGDRAFANTKDLRFIYIPESTTEIGKDILSGTKVVTISGASNSYARTWANNNGIPFAPITVFSASGGNSQVSGVYLSRNALEKLSSHGTIDIPKCSEAKGRTNGEIIAAKHEECFAFSLQGRSPPMKG